MANEFLQLVNLDLLSKELGTDVNGISKMIDVSSQTIYKWARAKDKGGCRPTYDSIYLLIKSGASLKSLFGLDTASSIPKKLDHADFLEGVRQALVELAGKNSND